MDISLKNPNRKAELDEEIGLAVYFLTKQDTLYPTKSMPIYPDPIIVDILEEDIKQLENRTSINSVEISEVSFYDKTIRVNIDVKTDVEALSIERAIKRAIK